MKRVAILVSALIVLAACGGASETPETGPGTGAQPGETGSQATGGTGGNMVGPEDGMIDPKDDGLEVALGEWAVTLEAAAIRPGRVTFVVVNRGTIGHGFEIELEGGDGDSSGSGSGGDDGIKAETNLLQPGERAELTLNLPAGTYKVECIVQGHDDLGMEGFLEVRPNAPLVDAGASQGAGEDTVSISNFAFDPAELSVAAGTEVTWTNEDPAPHTVTADDGSFDSGTLEPGQTFSVTIDGNGPVTYACQIHPDMTGTVAVG